MFKHLMLAVTLALGLNAGLPAATDLAATMLRAEGKGRVVLPTGTDGEFKAGVMLRAGSRILTEESALAVLLLADGSRVNIGPNTDLTIADLSEDGGKNSTVFELLKGLFKASVQKLTVGSRFEVKTPDAVAAVKGTEYEVEVTDKGTEARVKEGKVWLEDAAREHKAVVGKRMSCTCDRKGPLHDPRRMTRDEVRHFGEWAKESTSGHSGAYLPVDQAKQAAWAALRPEQREQVRQDLIESLGDTWDDIVGLSAEERQERWRDRLRDNDSRRMAAEGAKVDFALGKCAIDRQGRRVRFDEFVLRPAGNQLQFLNYTRRDDRTDLVSAINTYNTNLPHNLSDATGLNQRLWLQGYSSPPQYWVTDSALVAGNSANDSFATSTSFYDPYFRTAGFWELPVKDVDVRMNIPDLHAPRVGGMQVEHWVRTALTNLPSPTLTAAVGANRGTLAVLLRSAPGTTNNIPNTTDINASNLVWAMGINGTQPTTTLLDLSGLEAKPGDLAFGFKRTYNTNINGELGKTLEFRTYVINENGEVVNLAGVPPDKLLETFVNRKLIASLEQIEIRSNLFNSDDGINIVSKLLFLHDLTKTQDQL